MAGDRERRSNADHELVPSPLQDRQPRKWQGYLIHITEQELRLNICVSTRVSRKPGPIA